MKMLSKGLKGFTLVEIMIVVAIIGILIAIAVPGFVRARTQSRTKACQENLTKLSGAMEQYALENNLAVGASVAMSDLITGSSATNYLKETPVCPGGGSYTVSLVGTDPTCSLGAPHDLGSI